MLFSISSRVSICVLVFCMLNGVSRLCWCSVLKLIMFLFY